MLERVPKIKCVTVKPENKKHKSFILKSVRANAARIKRFAAALEDRSSGIINYDGYRNLRKDLRLASRPPDDLVLFAGEVGSAWDGTPEEERKELRIPKNYASRRTTESALFSVSGSNLAIRRIALGRLVIRGKNSHQHGRILALLDELEKAKAELRGVRKKLKELGVVLDSIELNGGPVSYIIEDSDGIRTRMSFPDFKKAKNYMLTDAEQVNLEIAMRFCFGFSSVQ